MKIFVILICYHYFCIYYKKHFMSQSLSKLYIHITFHVKSTSVKIDEDIEPELYAYIGRVITDLDGHPIIINGVSDHIHILCAMSKNITLSKFVEDIKRHSSRWIKNEHIKYRLFSWQSGYGAFTVSSSVIEKTKQYIANQKNHHKRISFRDEYIAFLTEYKIDYDERYLMSD